MPGIARVVAAHDIPVFLHEQHTWPGWVRGQVVNTVTDFGALIREFARGDEAAIDRQPCQTAIVGAECTGR